MNLEKFKTLTPRIVEKVKRGYPIPNKPYQYYVRWSRYKLGHNRESLTKMLDLTPDFLSYLENGNLNEGELTSEIKLKLDETFNTTFESWMAENRGEVEQTLAELDKIDEEFSKEYPFG